MKRQYPPVDRRRASELLAELQQTAATMLPEWRAATDPEDVGRALLAIAAHLAEHVTERLDRTPERDEIEFLRFLDTPRQPVEVATVPLVFTLAEGRGSPVYVPARSQAAAAGEGEEIIFETREAISLQPARLSALFAVDPALDRIEVPPPDFLLPPGPRLSLPPYSVASFAANQSNTLQITPALGLTTNAVIRIEEHDFPYRIEMDRGGGVFGLLDRLERPAAQGTRVTKITAFQMFRLRNLQEHAVYLGHESLFNLEQPADITLLFTPPHVVALMAGLQVSYSLWSKNEDAQGGEAAWIDLLPTYGNGLVRLRKWWRGSVETRPLPRREDQNRWLRISIPPTAPIVGAANIGTTTDRIAVEVSSFTPPQSSNAEGSQTITRALHNVTPLPLGSRFFPFGTQPVQFDTFAIAAPEALSKRGAVVRLEVNLVDASPASISVPLTSGGPPRAYAISESGTLQIITLNAADGSIDRWQGLGFPTLATASGTPGARLSENFPPLAVQILATIDLVIVLARDSTFWATVVESVPNGYSTRAWQEFPALPPNQRIASATLLSTSSFILLLALTNGGLYALGDSVAGWTLVAETPGSVVPTFAGPDPSSPPPHLVAVQPTNFPAPVAASGIVVADATGALWSGNLSPQGGGNWSTAWRRLTQNNAVSLDVRPAAVIDGNGLLIFAATAADRQLIRLSVPGTSAPSIDYSGFTCDIGSSVLCAPQYEEASGSFVPLAVAFGTQAGVASVALWTPQTSTVVVSPVATRSAAIVFSLRTPRAPLSLIQSGPDGETLSSSPFSPPSSSPPPLGQPTYSRFPRNYQNPSLSWEYFNGRSWRRLESGFSDTTFNFEGDGIISFTVPDDLAQTEIAGQEDYWIRARLVGGDYGRPRFVVTTALVSSAPLTTSQTIVVDTSDLNPPEILSIDVTFTPSQTQQQRPVRPEKVFTDNNYTLRDQTQANDVDGAVYELFEGAQAIDPAAANRKALYLGLSGPLSDGSLSIFIDAEEHEPSVDLEAQILVGSAWVNAGLRDETAGLQRRGFLHITLGERPTPSLLFGNDTWVWLRLRPRADVRDWQPDLRAVLINTALGEQAESVSQELLGSSDGSPDQRFLLSRRPVLTETRTPVLSGAHTPGPSEEWNSGLELRVSETLGVDEQRALDVAHYPDIPGEWVRWRRAESFVDYDNSARVFLLDPISGEIRFGNNRSGKVPPAGQDNIRAISYRAGGGARGNVPAFSIEDLKAAIESVEDVLNPLPAAGGVDEPTREQQVDRAPARLQHRDQAITPRDLEALALAFSPNVVRARCLPPARAAEPITLVVAMRNGERCPPLSLERRDALIAYLRRRDGGVFDAAELRVRAPDYRRLEVTVQLRVADLTTAARIEQESHQRIFALLDPLAGGPDGRGWPFGRPLRRSDILRVLSNVEGIDQVIEVMISALDEGAPPNALGTFGIVCAANSEDVRVVVSGAGGGS